MKEIYYVRHGESEANRLKISSGQSETPLSKKGVIQASQTGEDLKSLGIKFDLIICSPLSRAYDTAKLIADKVNYPKSKIQILDALKERSFGEFEGKPMFVGTVITLDQYLTDPYILDKYEGVEKVEDLHSRALNVWKEIEQFNEQTILIVAHGAVGRAIQRAASNLKINDDVGYQDNAQIIKLS